MTVPPEASVMRDDPLLAELAATVSGFVRGGEPLAAHTTLRVGGPAAVFVQAQSTADLAAVAAACARHGRAWLVLGRGSNLLIADSGWPGVVVTLGRGFRGVDIDGEHVVAGSGEPMPVLANTVARRGLGGLAFGVAIPGSLGGAVRMNAGAHGHELSEILEWVEVARLGNGATLERLSVTDLRMSYRRAALPSDAIVVRARLALERVDPRELAADMAAMRQWRRDHQPINAPSCGSVFRNPDGDAAGRLIELAGMKGYRVGGAQVSPVHANFITVSPGARAGDVYAVITAVRDAVAARCGVCLQTEVVVVGFEDPGRCPSPRPPERA